MAIQMKSSLTFYYEINSGTVSLDKDKYLTPAPALTRTRTSHDSQYTRSIACSDALDNSFFPRAIPLRYFRIGVKLLNSRFFCMLMFTQVL